MKKLLLLSLLLLLTSACTTATHRYAADDPRSAQVWTPSAVVDEMAGRDPLEPFNRAMFSVNDVLMHYLVRPFSWIYGSILPKEVIKRIDYASENLAFPGRMLSCFLQAKFLGGGIVLVRFVTNSTVGIAGLFDPADAWLGLPPVKENMGKAFASWGIGLHPVHTAEFRHHVPRPDRRGVRFCAGYQIHSAVCGNRGGRQPRGQFLRRVRLCSRDFFRSLRSGKNGTGRHALYQCA